MKRSVDRKICKETPTAKWLQDRCPEIAETENKHDHFNIHKLVKVGRIKPRNLNNIVKDFTTGKIILNNSMQRITREILQANTRVNLLRRSSQKS